MKDEASAVDYIPQDPSDSLLDPDSHVDQLALQKFGNKRSSGPYEIFWKENDPYGHHGRREVFSPLTLAE